MVAVVADFGLAAKIPDPLYVNLCVISDVILTLLVYVSDVFDLAVK